MMQKSALKSVFALFFFCSSLFSQAVYAQGFSSIDNDLQTLENLLNDTIANTEEQQRLLEDLKTNLNESGIKISIHADFYPRSLLRKLHQKPSVFAWKQRHPWRGIFASSITVKRRGRRPARKLRVELFPLNMYIDIR